MIKEVLGSMAVPVSSFDSSDEKANYWVVKANSLVQKTHYSMPLVEQKILASLIKNIKPDQTTLVVKFNVKQFMQMVGLSNSGNNFENIKACLLDISKRNFWIKLPNGKYKLWQWLNDVTADGRNGTFKVEFKKFLRPFLLNQRAKGYFTQYKFEDIRAMSSNYSPRLYEYFRSMASKQGNHGMYYSLNELKYRLALFKRNKKNHNHPEKKPGHFKYIWDKYYYKYSGYADFRRRVLTPAKTEINAYTAYNISFKPRKVGRKVVGIVVKMHEKSSKEKQAASMTVFNRIHNTHLTIDDMIRNTPKYRKYVKEQFRARGKYGEHYVSGQIINMKGYEVEYYDQFKKHYVWTTREDHEAYMHRIGRR